MYNLSNYKRCLWAKLNNFLAKTECKFTHRLLELPYTKFNIKFISKITLNFIINIQTSHQRQTFHSKFKDPCSAHTRKTREIILYRILILFSPLNPPTTSILHKRPHTPW